MLKPNQIYNGDCLETMKFIDDGSINSCITSPPYWALRDYGVEGQLGLETTFEEYIDKLCNIFDEVKRVLRKDGTCWVVVGDTYWGGCGGPQSWERESREIEWSETSLRNPHRNDGNKFPSKSLVMIPFRFAIEMVNRGWILRNTIIWYKPNCMPASVKDRFTVDFEYIFFFVKNKKYWFEQQFEEFSDSTIPRMLRGVSDNHKNIDGAPGQTPHSMNKPRDNITKETLICDKCNGMGFYYEYGHSGETEYYHECKECNSSGHVIETKYINENYGGSGTSFKGHSGYKKADGTLLINPNGRNKRSVWTVTTKPFKEAHFATYPPDLIEPMVKAGCPEDGIILDPFFGAGTTGLVAKQLNRNYIGIELNKEYCSIAYNRINKCKNV